MNVSDLKNSIEQNNYYLKISNKISLPITLQSVNATHGSLDNYLNQNKATSTDNYVSVQLYKNPNNKGFNLVDTVMVTLFTNSKPLVTSISSAPIQTQVKQSTMSEITPAQLENYGFKIEIKHLTENNTDLKERNKKLERDNTTLYDEVTAIRRELLVHKDAVDLEYKHKELAISNEKKAGLAGLVGDIMTQAKDLPPEGWNLINGIMQKFNMAVPMNGATSTTALEGIKHTNADAQACIEIISEKLVTEHVGIVGFVTEIVDRIVSNKTDLKNVYDLLFPGKLNEASV
jgi:hypothetical protein